MALPLCLDRLVNVIVALVLSTTAIVVFGECGMLLLLLVRVGFWRINAQVVLFGVLSLWHWRCPAYVLTTQYALCNVCLCIICWCCDVSSHLSPTTVKPHFEPSRTPPTPPHHDPPFL